MGKDFLPENFLLSTPASEKLYFEFAKDLPIFDYHCHIPPGDFGDTKAGEPLVIGWDNKPRRPIGAGVIQHVFACRHVAWLLLLPS
jgi:Glucuronate isomerase